MKLAISLIALVAATPALTEETRQLDAHEHGVGALNIAIDGTTVAMEFHAPGADIVGFEHAAESDADHAAIDAAIAKLSAPLDLFGLSATAACTLVKANAALEGEGGHDDDEHDEEHHEGHADEAHDDHAEHDHEKHDDHDHDAHAHDDHDDEDHHDGHDDHAENPGHSEFHAEYDLTCTNPHGLTEITFGYFDTFPNAQEVVVQLISATGAQAFEVTPDAPVLDLKR